MDYELLRERFRKVFEARWERSELEHFDELRERFAFHMAEVYQNLVSMADVYTNPAPCDVECLTDKLDLFFNHAMPHLVAAANIYDEIPHIFEEQDGVHDWHYDENELKSAIQDPKSEIRN